GRTQINAGLEGRVERVANFKIRGQRVDVDVIRAEPQESAGTIHFAKLVRNFCFKVKCTEGASSAEANGVNVDVVDSTVLVVTKEQPVGVDREVFQTLVAGVNTVEVAVAV